MKNRELLQLGESGIGKPPAPTTDVNDTRMDIERLEAEAQTHDRRCDDGENEDDNEMTGRKAPTLGEAA